jgi:hypothetical protein
MTDAQPRFRVVEYLPHYNDRDGVEFWEGRLIAATMTLGWAAKLAELADPDGMDERYIEIQREGRRLHRPGPTLADEGECPF